MGNPLFFGQNVTAGGASAPAFVRVIVDTYIEDNPNPRTLTATGNAEVGRRVVLAICYQAPPDTSSLPSDSGLNTWVLDASLVNDFGNLYIYSSVITNALVGGVSVIIVTSGTGNTERRGVYAVVVSGSSAVDTSANATGDSTGESTSATTSAATVGVAISFHNSNDVATPGAGWTEITGAGNLSQNACYQNFASAGTKTTGTSWGSGQHWGSLVVY